MQSLEQLVDQIYLNFKTKQSQELKSFVRKRPQSSNIYQKVAIQQSKRTLQPKERCTSTSALKLIKRQPTQSSERIFRQKPRFQIKKLIGQGTFSKVFQALDTFTDRIVALKKMNSNLEDAIETQLNEYQILSQLNHQNIVKCIINTKQFMVLEYIEGITLKEYIKKRKQLTERDALFIFDQLKSAVKEIHQCGICHKDLKPENIMIDEEMRIKVIDFGLASQTITQQESSGTLLYMAPEVFQNQSYNGQQADLWALGVILYQMVVGRYPFPGKDEIQIRLTQQQKIRFPKYVSEQMRNKIMNLLNRQKRFI
ncbi:hypothetical protein pb186bvf_011436 [Paramecium bursaria]